MKKTMLCIVVLALVPFGASAQETGNVCVLDFQQPANCTANDVRIEEFIPLDVIEDCLSGVEGEAEMLFQVVVQAADQQSGSPDRYDLGVFISLDEGNAIDGDLCFHDYFPPPLNDDPQPGDYGDDNGDFVPDIVDGPWPDIDAGSEDTCGDIVTSTQNIKTLQTIRFACVDRPEDGNMDGEADLSWCVSWGNNQNNRGGELCTGLSEAIPSTPAKCSCGVADLGIPVPVELESFSIER